MQNDDMMERMLKKRKPMLTITIGAADDKGEEMKDLAPEMDEEDAGEEMAEAVPVPEDAMEKERLMAMLGDDTEGDESEEMPGGRKPTIGELAKMKMKARLKSLNK